MMTYQNYLLDSTILNFMSVSLGIKRAINEEYQSKWRKLDYNFYADYYCIEDSKKGVLIRWENANRETHFILFRRPRFNVRWLNVFYFKLFKQVVTDDSVRYHNVLQHVIYPAFCKDVGIDADFSDVKTPLDAADKVMYNLYKNFFSKISIDRFIDSFSLKDKIPKSSVENIISSVK